MMVNHINVTPVYLFVILLLMVFMHELLLKKIERRIKSI